MRGVILRVLVQIRWSLRREIGYVWCIKAGNHALAINKGKPHLIAQPHFLRFCCRYTLFHSIACPLWITTMSEHHWSPAQAATRHPPTTRSSRGSNKPLASTRRRPPRAMISSRRVVARREYTNRSFQRNNGDTANTSS